MKVVDVIADRLCGELAEGSLPGIALYEDLPEHRAALDGFARENPQQFRDIEAAYTARQAFSENQFFRAGLAMGLQLAAETFSGLSESGE